MASLGILRNIRRRPRWSPCHDVRLVCRKMVHVYNTYYMFYI